MIFFNFFKIIVHFFQNYFSLFMRASHWMWKYGYKKRVGFLRLFSLICNINGKVASGYGLTS